MRKIIAHLAIGLFFFQLIACKTETPQNEAEPANAVISRIVGAENISKFELSIDSTLTQSYTVNVQDNKVHITAASQVGLCRGAYDFLKNACKSQVTWSGNNINIPEQLPDYSASVQSPYQYHYYFNVVTHGYTTPYWDWNRWQEEIDWMAIHGINMPLLPGAHEAILLRVFKKLGFTSDDIKSYFTGPAHFPWNKMGNITGWDNQIPETYFDKQIQLNHQILDRIDSLDMYPIIPAFAGFVPASIQQLFPEERVRELSWGAFDKQYHAYILEPGSDLFIKIGKLYIQEYEKEFGKQKFYLADSFNEMDVPLSENKDTALNELAGYGASVYHSIQEANPEATWVMQGWTFPFHQKDGELFWTPERLEALVSKVPDDKLLILDLANEYNKLSWNIEPSWKIYPGFFGKQWIYSFIPNMGGKTAWNGRLDLYASMPYEALHYENKKNLVGFGFAPEGIENNDMVYELLADVSWSGEEIDLDKWVERYATNRYGSYPPEMKEAYDYLRKSCLGSFSDHPRNTFQFRPNSEERGTINDSPEFEKAVQLFLKCQSIFEDSPLYQIDAIELSGQYLSLKADKLLEKFLDAGGKDMALLDSAQQILLNVDRLYESHPNWRLERWTDFAKTWGDNADENNYFASNAKRLITTWGYQANDYAAKTWSGLIRDYYVPRWKLYYEAKNKSEQFDLLQWEENWIQSTTISQVEPFKNPVGKAYELVRQASKE